MQHTFSETWDEFCAGVQASTQRLIRELKASSEGLQRLSAEEKKSWELILFWQKPAGRISSLHSLFSETAEQLLEKPLESFRNARIAESNLGALDRYRREIAHLIIHLPAAVPISGLELGRALAQRGGIGWTRHALLSLKRKPEDIPLRRLAEQCAVREESELVREIEPIFVLTSQAILELSLPWQALRREALQRLSGFKADSRPMRLSGKRWLRRLNRHSNRLDRLLKRMLDWTGQANSRLDAALLDFLRPAPGVVEAGPTLAEFASGWSRNYAAARARLKLEGEICGVTHRVIRHFMDNLQAVNDEHTVLQTELQELIGWLDVLQRGQDRPAPVRRVAVVSASERAADCRLVVTGEVRTGLPERLEILRAPTPFLRPKPLRIEISVRAPFLDAVEEALSLSSEAFLRSEAAHRRILADIERARQVVDFGRESTMREAEDGRKLAEEAVVNARRLLDHRKRAPAGVHAALERMLADGLVSSLNRLYMLLDHRRSGLRGLIDQLGFRSAAVFYSLVLRGSAIRQIRRLRVSAAKAARAVRTRSGAAEGPPAPVSTRIGFDTHSSLPIGAPPVYSRVFDPRPLEDLRFLVGRDVEINALGSLRERWESGRSTACLIAGERGSGKASLLNCATSRIFRDVDLARCKFTERTATAAAMRRFLSSLLNVSNANDLDTEVAGRRRVVMLEGLERSFLRQVGGYGGLRELLRLVTLSSDRILWILTANEACLRFLDRALHLRQYFTHVVHTMPVERQHIEKAIFLRHHLTGWRLHVSAPPASPEVEGFPFESLPADSEGIFGVAFDLWLSSIESAEDGVLYIRYPDRRAAVAAVSALEDRYLHTILALMLHGGLTVQEHAAIFGIPTEESQAVLETLEDGELAETSTDCAGFRVRSKAIGLVRRALQRRNLLN